MTLSLSLSRLQFLNESDRAGNTPLMEAVRNQKEHMVTYLLGEGSSYLQWGNDQLIIHLTHFHGCLFPLIQRRPRRRGESQERRWREGRPLRGQVLGRQHLPDPGGQGIMVTSDKPGSLCQHLSYGS